MEDTPKPVDPAGDPDPDPIAGWEPPPTDPHVLEQFWDLARTHARFNYAPGYFGPSVLDVVIPPTLTLGNTPESALESLSALVADEGAVLRSPVARGEEELPQPGALGIVVDDQGHPRALVATTKVEVQGEDLVEELTVLYAE